MNVTKFAHEIIEMERIIHDQAWEINRLREYEAKYHELLGSSLEHSQHMVGNTLTLLMTPGVTESLQRAAQKEPS